MKKIVEFLIFVGALLSVAFADVVGPVYGISGMLGVEYMHGSGLIFSLPTYLVTMAIIFVLLAIIMLIVIKIMKKKNSSDKAIKTVRLIFLAIAIISVIASIIVIVTRLNK